MTSSATRVCEVCMALSYTKGTHRALCERLAILDPFSPTAKVTAVTTVSLYTGLLRFFLGPKTQTMS